MRIITTGIGLQAMCALFIILIPANHAESSLKSDSGRRTVSDVSVPHVSAFNQTAPSRPPHHVPSSSSGREMHVKYRAVFVMSKPEGMSDDEYRRLLNHMSARQMTEPERDDFWKNVSCKLSVRRRKGLIILFLTSVCTLGTKSVATTNGEIKASS